MPFYVQANLEGKTAVHSRLTEKGQDTHIEISFKDFLPILNDFISDFDQLSDEQFEKLLDFADEIQSVSVLRAAEAVCAGCDGKNCVSCQNFKTITGQE